MSVHFIIPLLLTLGCLAVAWFLPRALSPSVGVIALTTFISLSALGAFMVLGQVAGAGTSEIPFVSDALGWCRALYGGEHGAPPLLGITAALLLIISCSRIGLYVRNLFRQRQQFFGIDGVIFLETNEPIAFAIPGRRGGVVLSHALLANLDASERSVVLAHENAHLRHRHHLYVRIAEGCAAGFPFLRPFARRVRFLTERWADEVAADRVGSRDFVAATIARVALLSPTEEPQSALAISGGNVVARFDALLLPLPPARTGIIVLASSLVSAAIFGLILQLHHFVDFLTHAGQFST